MHGHLRDRLRERLHDSVRREEYHGIRNNSVLNRMYIIMWQWMRVNVFSRLYRQLQSVYRYLQWKL